jgi:CheY-like chemotaxis protein
MDGFTILTKLGTNPVLRDIPVIVYSTATLTRERQRQLTDFGQNLYRIGTLNENEIFLMLEKALNRLGDRKGG